MADTTPDPEELKKMAAAKEAAISEKVAVPTSGPTVQEMSKGMVSEPVSNPVQGYADQLHQQANTGIDEHGNVLSPEQRQSRFQAAKGLNQQMGETRFTMPQQGGPVATPTASAPSSVASAAAPAASATAPVTTVKPGMWGKLTGGLTEGIHGGRGARTGKALGLMAVDSVVPRADNNTALGWGVNRLRDMSYGAAQAELNGTDMIPNMPLRLGLDAAGAAYGLVGGYGQDQKDAQAAATPTPEGGYQWKLPQAQPNFWSQSGAAMDDAGHVVSQARDALKQGISYDLDHYTPYPYVQKGAQAVADYFTPPGNTLPQAPQPGDKTFSDVVNVGSGAPYRDLQPSAQESLAPNLAEIAQNRINERAKFVRDDEARRWAEHDAKEQMEAASAARLNGNPLHDVPIQQNIARAAQAMAQARGANPEDPNFAIEASKYIPRGTGLGSERETQLMANKALRGEGTEDLVNYAVSKNNGGSDTALAQNQLALGQNAKMQAQSRSAEAMALKSENEDLKKEKYQSSKAKNENAADRAVLSEYIKGLHAQIKEGSATDIDYTKGPEGKAVVRQLNAAMKRLSGLLSFAPEELNQPEVAEEESQMKMPDKKSLSVGQIIDTPKGKMKWTGKGLIPA